MILKLKTKMDKIINKTNKTILPVLTKEQIKNMNCKPTKEFIDSCKKAGRLFGEPK